jgi:hypothetical protein
MYWWDIQIWFTDPFLWWEVWILKKTCNTQIRSNTQTTCNTQTKMFSYFLCFLHALAFSLKNLVIILELTVQRTWTQCNWAWEDNALDLGFRVQTTIYVHWHVQLRCLFAQCKIPWFKIRSPKVKMKYVVFWYWCTNIQNSVKCG